MKVRQDAWTEEDDLLLAETVLRHVREGSTQLNAFEEVGDKLNRTSAACGFRWNAVVRHNYDKALSLAKKQRKQRQRILGKDQGGKKRLLYTPPAPMISDIMAPHLQEEEIDLEVESAVIESTNYETAEEFTIDEAFVPLQQRNTTTIPTNTAAMSLDMVIAYLESMNGRLLQAEVLQTEKERLKLEIKGLKGRNEELQNKVSHLEQNSGLMQEDYETLMNIMNRARKLVLLEEEERPATKFKMDRNGNLEKMAE